MLHRTCRLGIIYNCIASTTLLLLALNAAVGYCSPEVNWPSYYANGGVLPLIAGFSVSTSPSACAGLQISLYSNESTVGPLYSVFAMSFQNPDDVFIGSAIDTDYRTVYTYVPMVAGQEKNRLGRGGWLVGLQVEIEQYYNQPTNYFFTGGLLTSPFVSTLQPSAMAYEPISQTVWVVAQIGLNGPGVVASIDPVHGNYSIIYEIPSSLFAIVNPTPVVVNPIANTFSFFIDIAPVGQLFTISTTDYSMVTHQPIHYHNSSSIGMCGLVNWDVDVKTGIVYGLCMNTDTNDYWLSEINLETATPTPIGDQPLIEKGAYIQDFSFALNWKDNIAYVCQSSRSSSQESYLVSANYQSGTILPSIDVR
eukprot:TRINITY_DN4460_c0_g1_i4.p1 TRINITY_DN4460_c0_g1~~TRINITY_DN4460_c0_g1_i4.p1  ORF type:complete len:383 (+),score=65.00 TRINITY_DN4460_c0_g1_i4:57-1151(+)